VLAGGVAGEPGVEVCPELLLEPPADAPPPAETLGYCPTSTTQYYR